MLIYIPISYIIFYHILMTTAINKLELCQTDVISTGSGLHRLK